MDFFETVANRTSVRAFKPRKITAAEWDALMKAAMAAPSAVNKQPWEFVIIEARDTLKKLAEALPNAKMAADAPGAVLVCTLPEKANRGLCEYAAIDASAACENLLLAATALGLGAVWTAVYPNHERENPVRAILGLPEGVIPFALVPIGESAGPVAPKDKYRPELIHRESW